MTTIIVGSGIGGLAAAKALVEAGKKVLVLEAANVVGGRLCTQNVDIAGKPFAFDLGASWIHGSAQANPITQLSASVPGVKMIETLDDKIEVFDGRGEQIQKEVDLQWEDYEELQGKLEDEAEKGESVEAVLKRLDASKLANPVFMYHISSDMEFQTSASISQLSAKLGASDEQIEGTEMLIVSGYQRFAQALVDKHRIEVLLNHRVVEVTYRQEEEQTVLTCANGKQFTADSVVLNVPIGVLKKGAIKFNPRLPKEKSDAIERIGFGNVCKVLVIFKQPPTTSKEHYIGVVADNPAERGLFTYFLNIYALAGLPALMTFGLGGNADTVETMPEEQAKILIAKRISCFAEREILPSEFTIQRTNWRNKDNTFGAYAYAHVNTREDDWQEMARPIFDYGWYFCGEHTTQKYRGTVHGAFLSGEKAGDDIVNEIEDKDWVYEQGEQGGEEVVEQEEDNEANRQKQRQESSSEEDNRKGKQARRKGPEVRGSNKPQQASVEPQSGPQGQSTQAPTAKCCSVM